MYDIQYSNQARTDITKLEHVSKPGFPSRAAQFSLRFAPAEDEMYWKYIESEPLSEEQKIERHRQGEVLKHALDQTIRTPIIEAIESKLMRAPEAFGKPLRYSLRLLRTLRIGDWRILYQLSGTTVFIVTIRHRKKGYGR